MSEEKRAAKRIHKRFILRAAVFGEEPKRWSYVTILNLSSSGAYFTFDRPVPVGALLYFKIDFPDRVVECMGRVRRASDGSEGKFQNIGATFEGISAENKRYINEFVDMNGGI